MILDKTVNVVSNEALGNGNFLLTFAEETMAGKMRPGQFFMIGMPGTGILLRRPFSVCGLPGTFENTAAGALQVLYKVMGQGTRVLSGLGPGAALTVLGPLGNGFTLPEPDVTPVFVAGGIGSAPFPALARARTAAGGSPAVMFYGARSAADLPLLEWFGAHCAELHTATEDGSAGEKGLVTAPLLRWMEGRDRESYELIVCGPDPMLKAIRNIAVPAGIRCHLSLEAHMACGFGVCIGCVVPTHGEDGEVRYTRICVDGPVLPAEKLAW
jgi:dihydroorotate dehydrogenase electron transfer subunit